MYAALHQLLMYFGMLIKAEFWITPKFLTEDTNGISACLCKMSQSAYHIHIHTWSWFSFLSVQNVSICVPYTRTHVVMVELQRGRHGSLTLL